MEDSLTIELVQQVDYRFEAHFDNAALPPLVTDEPSPLGHDAGPNPTRLLGTAVANCLAASLLFSMRKFKNTPDPIRAEATVRLVRNEEKRLRVGGMEVALHLAVPASSITMLDRILAQFEDFCVVTQSVRQSFPVDVRVFDGEGVLLKQPGPG